jgi:hypothetical protein
MPAQQHDMRLVELVHTTPDYLPEHAEVHCLVWETDDIHRRQRPSALGVNIAQGVCRRNLPEIIRVIDDGRKKVHVLDERQVIRDAVHAGVVPVVKPDDDIRVEWLADAF